MSNKLFFIFHVWMWLVLKLCYLLTTAFLFEGFFWNSFCKADLNIFHVTVANQFTVQKECWTFVINWGIFWYWWNNYFFMLSKHFSFKLCTFSMCKKIFFFLIGLVIFYNKCLSFAHWEYMTPLDLLNNGKFFLMLFVFGKVR